MMKACWRSFRRNDRRRHGGDHLFQELLRNRNGMRATKVDGIIDAIPFQQFIWIIYNGMIRTPQYRQ